MIQTITIAIPRAKAIDIAAALPSGNGLLLLFLIFPIMTCGTISVKRRRVAVLVIQNLEAWKCRELQ
jgi:hypothetical protein